MVKVENLLCLRLEVTDIGISTPNFSDRPTLTPQGARLGLCLMGQALPDLDIKDMRILDVLRGETFSVEKYPLNGDEEDTFKLRYRGILREWRAHFH